MDRASTTAAAVVSTELVRGRSIARQFYRAELDLLHEQFTPNFASHMTVEALTRMHETMRRQLGPEQELLGERLGSMANGQWLYVRLARFDRYDGEVEVRVKLEQDLSVDGFQIRPTVPEGKTP